MLRKGGAVPDANERQELTVERWAFDLYIRPEIERRRAAGTLPHPSFTLSAAQVIFNLDSDAPEVRLHEEVKAYAKVRATRAIDKGEALTEADFDSVKELSLTDDDPNAAHVTIMHLWQG